MNKSVDPKLFGLPPSTRLKQIGTAKFDIVIQRKSRIIMKDGEGVLAKADKIKKHVPNAQIGLVTSAPVCSKTRAFLKEHGVSVSPC